MTRIVGQARDIVGNLAGTTRVMGLVWAAHPGYATALVALNVLQGVEPLAQIWVTKLVLDAIVGAMQAGMSIATDVPGPAVLDGLGNVGSEVAAYIAGLIALRG